MNINKTNFLYKTKTKLFSFILIYLFIFTSLFIYFIRAYKHTAIKITGTYIANPQDLKPFKLEDNLGNPLTKKRFQGRWTLVFFGFTQCPTVCPGIMHVLDKAYKELQKTIPKDKKLQVIFISVDPKRDSLEKLNYFVQSFNKDFIGARANEDEIKKLQQALHLPLSENPINHGLELLLFNEEAKVQAYFSYTIKPEQLAKEVKMIISRAN